MSGNLELWNSWANVPKEAQKPIQAGRLKGMTDINPMWRYKVLTDTFGAVGFGWYTANVAYTVLDGANGEKVAHCELDLYVKQGGEWSQPIHGQGGSMLIAGERNGLHTSDEAFKMAYTDAISVACKQLGIGAGIYWSAGNDSKYRTDSVPQTQEKIPQTQQQKPVMLNQSDDDPLGLMMCSECGVNINEAVYNFSQKVFHRPLCRECQQKVKAWK